MRTGGAATAVPTLVPAVVLVVAVAIFAVTRPTPPGPGTPPAAVPTGQATPTPRAGSATPADRGSGGPSRSPRPAPTGPALPSPTSSVCVPRTEQRRLTVVSFNIHSARARDDTVRLAEIGDELVRWRPDVVLLQEVDRGRAWTGRTDMPAYLAARLGAEWTFGANVRRTPGNEYGTAILSRLPILSSRNVLLPAPPGTQQRGLLHAVVDAGVEVSLYDTHLEHTSRSAREAQMRAIAPLLRADPRAKILGGDLNSIPGSAVLTLARTLLRDTWTEVGSGSGHTAPGRNPRLRIDYLLYADGEGADLTPRAAQLLRSSVSDHRAVRAAYDLGTGVGEVCVPDLSAPVGG